MEKHDVNKHNPFFLYSKIYNICVQRSTTGILLKVLRNGMICTHALTSIMLMFQGLKSAEDDSRNNPTNPTMPASVNKGSKTVESAKVPVCVYM